jgi:hypothetical protein
VLSPDQLKDLPDELRRDLLKVAIELNMEKALAVIEQISAHDATLGSALKELARNLDFDSLLELLESGSDDAGS